MKDQSIDMLNGKLSNKLIKFALPIAACSMAQQLFNSCDTAVVGRFADNNALAAVGTNGEVVGLIVTLSSGLAIGANVLIASLIGSNKKENINRTIHTALLFSLIFGFVGLLIGIFISKPLMIIMGVPSEVLNNAILYLQIYFLGYPFLLLYDFGSAILRSKGDSKRPFLILLASGVVNVGLNFLFVIPLHMGVAGVAIATDISTAISAILVIVLLLKEKDEFKFSFSKLNISKDQLARILKIGVPAALQGAVFCLANIFIQAYINSFGSIAIDGNTVSLNFEYFAYFMITAFTQATTTFVSQNYSAKEYKRCFKILLLSFIYAIVFSGLIAVPISIFSNVFCKIFTIDQEIIQSATERIMIVLILEPMIALFEIPAGYLRGVGYSLAPALISIIGTCAFRIIWLYTYCVANPTLYSIYIVFPITWAITTTVMWIFAGIVIAKNNRENKRLIKNNE